MKEIQVKNFLIIEIVVVCNKNYVTTGATNSNDFIFIKISIRKLFSIINTVSLMYTLIICNLYTQRNINLQCEQGG